MASYAVAVADGGGGRSRIFEYKSPYDYRTDQEWLRDVAAAKTRYISYLNEYKKTANQIIDLNLQLMAISNTKGFLFECKNNIQSADTMMSKVNENNIQYDYGSTFHPMIEKLTEKAGNKVCGFDESVDELNSIRTSVKKDLKSLGSELEDYYHELVHILNEYYFIVPYYNLDFPNSDYTNNLIAQATEVE